MSLLIAIPSSPFTLLPLLRDLQCDCDKHLRFSFSIILLPLVALAYTRSVSFFHLPVFFPFFLSAHCHLYTLPSIVVPFFLQLSFSLHFKIVVIDISKCNPIAHMSFKGEVFTLKQDIHTFKDISFTALDPNGFTGLHTYQPAHKVKCRTNRCELMIFMKVELEHYINVYKGRHLGYLMLADSLC